MEPEIDENQPDPAADATTPASLIQSASVTSPKLDPTTSDQPFNERGVNHAGDGWLLTVIVKSSYQLPLELRKVIRNLLENADAVADKFYDIEQKEK